MVYVTAQPGNERPFMPNQHKGAFSCMKVNSRHSFATEMAFGILIWRKLLHLSAHKIRLNCAGSFKGFSIWVPLEWGKLGVIPALV